MKATGSGDGEHFVVVRRDDAGKLRDACGVAARGEPDEEFATEAENVAAFGHAGKLDVFEFAKWLEGGGDGRSFAAAAFGAEREDDGEFIEHESRVFDEHGVGKIGLGGQRDDAGT